jgi:Na+-transporting methylmalonyl-CoA/oxaloacetate decarboxylase gamma subunit
MQSLGNIKAKKSPTRGNLTMLMIVIFAIVLMSKVAAAQDVTDEIRQEQTKARQQQRLEDLRRQEQVRQLQRDQKAREQQQRLDQIQRQTAPSDGQQKQDGAQIQRQIDQQQVEQQLKRMQNDTQLDRISAGAGPATPATTQRSIPARTTDRSSPKSATKKSGAAGSRPAASTTTQSLKFLF